MVSTLNSRAPIHGAISQPDGESIPALPATFVLDAADLADHPLLAHIPVWPKDSEEFKSLRESLRADGQLYEVLVDSQRRVVDGRNRRNALGALGRMVVCRTIADEDVSTIVFRTLMQRRHVGKGARAFLAVPLVQPLIDGARARHLAILRAGGSISGSSGDAVTIDRIALDVGVHRDTLRQAERLHELLAEATEEVRADVTARVLSGELELGYAATSLANHRDAADKAANLDKRQRHDALFAKWWGKLPGQWETATAEQREAIREKLDSSMLQTPRELVETIHRAAARALKQLKDSGQA